MKSVLVVVLLAHIIITCNAWGKSNYEETTESSESQPNGYRRSSYSSRRYTNNWPERHQNNKFRTQQSDENSDTDADTNKHRNRGWRTYGRGQDNGGRRTTEKSSVEGKRPLPQLPGAVPAGPFAAGTATTPASLPTHKSSVKMPSGKNYKISDPKVPTGRRCSNEPELVNVEKTRKEFKVIEKQVQQYLQINKVTKVQKIASGCLWERYDYYRQTIEHESEAAANETFLIPGFYHDSDVTKTGFDEREAERHPGYPTGFYFYNSVTKPFPAGPGTVYLCRVALGKVYELTRPKSMPHAPVGYHSVSLTMELTAYIAFRGEQIYPEYIISYENGGAKAKEDEEEEEDE